jgi:hypothetical protein
MKPKSIHKGADTTRRRFLFGAATAATLPLLAGRLYSETDTASTANAPSKTPMVSDRRKLGSLDVSSIDLGVQNMTWKAIPWCIQHEGATGIDSGLQKCWGTLPEEQGFERRRSAVEKREIVPTIGTRLANPKDKLCLIHLLRFCNRLPIGCRKDPQRRSHSSRHYTRD